MLSDYNNPRKYRQIFNKNNLPSPIVYYTERNFRLVGNGNWCTTVCPFHDDSKPSLTVHVESGAFKCFACGAKGGDVLDFHKLLNGLSFVEAVTDLDAWETL